MPINTETYVKLEYNDFKIIENLMNQMDDLNDEETLVLAKVKKIIRLMKTKYERIKQENDTNSEMVK